MPVNGSLDYIEIPAPDMKATKAFYALFGWTFTDYGPDYTAFHSAGRNGGFNAERRVTNEGGPLIVLYAKDLDAMEKNIRAAGAEIFGRHSFPGGRRIHLRDPNGNEIAIWSEA